MKDCTTPPTTSTSLGGIACFTYGQHSMRVDCAAHTHTQHDSTDCTGPVIGSLEQSCLYSSGLYADGPDYMWLPALSCYGPCQAPEIEPSSLYAEPAGGPSPPPAPSMESNGLDTIWVVVVVVGIFFFVVIMLFCVGVWSPRRRARSESVGIQTKDGYMAVAGDDDELQLSSDDPYLEEQRRLQKLE